MPVIIKRLDARYDWLPARWGQGSYRLTDAGNGCDPSSSVAGAVAWVSEGGCSFFTKVWDVFLLLVQTLTYKAQQNNIQKPNPLCYFIIILCRKRATNNYFLLVINLLFSNSIVLSIKC